MAARRTYGSYNDGCASTHALDLIGERWALITVRELILGPKLFVETQRDIPGTGPAALPSPRLQELEAAGIVVRRKLRMPTHTTVYDLKDWGRDLETVNTALSLWAELVGRAQADRFLRRPYREPLEYLATLTTEAAWKTLIISGDPLENCKDIAVQGDGEAVLALLDVTRLQAPIKPGP